MCCRPIFRAPASSKPWWITKNVNAATAALGHRADEARPRRLERPRMLLRILTAAVLIPVVVALVWFTPPLVLAGAAVVIAGLALSEFFDLGERLGARPYRKWTLACSVGLFYAQYSLGNVETHTFGEGVALIRNTGGRVLPVELVFLIFLCGCVCIGLATRGPLQEVLPSVSISSSALLFVVLPFSYLIRMSEIPAVGRQLVLFVLSLIWAGDMLAYFVGRSLGRVPMAPAISPKKTLGGGARQSLRVAPGGCFLCALDGSGCCEPDDCSGSWKYCRSGGRLNRIRI